MKKIIKSILSFSLDLAEVIWSDETNPDVEKKVIGDIVKNGIKYSLSRLPDEPKKDAKKKNKKKPKGKIKRKKR